MTITAYTNATTVTATVNETLANTTATTDWDEQSISTLRGYPQAVTFHANRLWFGGLYSKPANVLASKISEYFNVFRDASVLAAKLFALLFGATMFSNFLNRAGLPDALLGIINSFDLSAMAVIGIILLIYILLGCVFESMSMILPTVPIFVPLVKSLAPELGLGADLVLIWFGILVVVVTEISLITPPIGLNVFVLKGVVKNVSVGTIFYGVTPFWVVDIIRLAIIVLFPAIALFLPSMMF